MMERRSSKLADLRYTFDIFWEKLVRLGDRLDSWLGGLAALATIAGVSFICRRLFAQRLVQGHPWLFGRHPWLRHILATPISSLVEDVTGLYGGLILVVVGIFTGLRWFIRRGQA